MREKAARQRNEHAHFLTEDERAWIEQNQERCRHCHHLLIFRDFSYKEMYAVCAVCGWEGCQSHGG